MEYRKTLNLPNTGFKMKANLSSREPAAIKSWENEKLYEQILKSRDGAPQYVLHDGPPYANGHIHIGHAINKILKDFIVKYKTMQGFYSEYVPGWDCHGLPIEHEVEKKLGSKKENLDVLEVRRECRKYAARFIDIQREEFKRLGIFAIWDDPYVTMNYRFEAIIMRQLAEFARRGSVYVGSKPVHWCASCRTALAEAEVEHEDHSAPSIFVKFELPGAAEKIGLDTGDPVFVVIWTTTPWTIPANKGISMHPEYDYVAARFAKNGEIYIVAEGMLESFAAKNDLGEYETMATFKAEILEKSEALHPLYGTPSLIMLGDHVTLEAGTGCVHTAPGHGQEDFEIGQKYGLPIYAPVDDNGRFTDEVELFAGQFVFDANVNVNKELEKAGRLVSSATLKHQYPHCWRCKKPVLFRSTPQWFISMETNDLRKKALDEIMKVQWVPGWGRERIHGMIANRPDWCISRQRAWGVPIPAFVCESCGERHLDADAADKLADLIEQHGADVWFEKKLEELLPAGMTCSKCGGTEFERGNDILDVWFDSGSSFAAVVEDRKTLRAPADLYLEGSDQHRGWFHSSLLVGVGTRDCAPYKSVLTHGFTVDGDGYKMSKSRGNVTKPEEVIKKSGAEILRLWTAATDYREDIRISEEILRGLEESYRDIRNRVRFMLGNVADFDPQKDAVPYSDMEELDRYFLHRFAKFAGRIEEAYETFEFFRVYRQINNFMAIDLSSQYLDILKDRLYTFAPNSPGRRSAQTAIYRMLDAILRMSAPIIAFTADEAYSYLPGVEGSVHLASFPKPGDFEQDDELVKKWDILFNARKVVTRALELARKNKEIGNSLEAKVLLAPPPEAKNLFDEYNSELPFIFIVSQVEVTENLDGEYFETEEAAGYRVQVVKAVGDKCERCWNYSESVGQVADHPTICERCHSHLKEGNYL